MLVDINVKESSVALTTTWFPGDRNGQLVTILNGTEANKQATLVELQEKGQLEELGILDKVLKVHGVVPASKGEGIICMIYENANGMSNRLSDNEKVEKAQEIHDK